MSQRDHFFAVFCVLFELAIAALLLSVAWAPSLGSPWPLSVILSLAAFGADKRDRALRRVRGRR